MPKHEVTETALIVDDQHIDGIMAILQPYLEENQIAVRVEAQTRQLKLNPALVSYLAVGPYEGMPFLPSRKLDRRAASLGLSPKGFTMGGQIKSFIEQQTGFSADQETHYTYHGILTPKGLENLVKDFKPVIEEYSSQEFKNRHSDATIFDFLVGCAEVLYV